MAKELLVLVLNFIARAKDFPRGKRDQLAGNVANGFETPSLMELDGFIRVKLKLPPWLWVTF